MKRLRLIETRLSSLTNQLQQCLMIAFKPSGVDLGRNFCRNV